MTHPKFCLVSAFFFLTAVYTAGPLHSQTTANPVPPVIKPTPPLRQPADAVTPTLKDPNRHAEFLRRIKEGDDIGLLFMGDSIMDNWPRHGEYSWLQFAPFHPADFGVSGDRTEHVLWRITNGELEGIHPKVVVLMIGTNNIGQVTTENPEWAAAGVQKIVDTIRERLPQTKVLLLAVFPRSTKDSRQRADVAKINAIIRKLDNGSSIRYLDIGHAFLDLNGEIPLDVMPDKLHPTAKGYDLWYNAMEPLLAQMLK
jgi:lysophospholipase L1-like esterase